MSTSTGELCVHSDTTDGDIVFVDSSENQLDLIRYGDAKHSTDQHKIGASSIFLNGSSYIIIKFAGQAGSPYPFKNLPNSDNFTIDAWVYFPDSLYSYQIIGNQENANQWSAGWAFWRDNSKRLRFTSGSVAESSGNSRSNGFVQNNTWTHVAAVRVNGESQIRLAINGVFDFTWANGTYGYWFRDSGIAPRLGGTGKYDSYKMKGYIDEFRISDTEAFYISDFTPQTKPYGYEGIDFVLEDGEYTPPQGDQVHFNMLPGEDYHEAIITASLPVPTVVLTGNAYAAPYNTINLNIPVPTVSIDGISWQGEIGDCHGNIVATLPVPSVEMFMQGAVIDISLPVPVVQITRQPEPVSANMAVSLPVPTVQMVQIAPVSATISSTISVPVVAMSGIASFTRLAVSLPVPSIMAYSGASIKGSLPVPSVSIVCGTAQSAIMSATLPVPAVSMKTGGHVKAVIPIPTVGIFATVTRNADISVTIPIPSIRAESGKHIVCTLPVPVIRVQADIAASCEISSTLPVPVASMFGSGSTMVSISETLPVPIVSMSSGSLVVATLPVPNISMQSDTHIIATISSTIPVPTITAIVSSSRVGSINAAIPVPRVNMTAEYGYNTISESLPVPSVNMKASNNGITTMLVTLAVPTFFSMGSAYETSINLIEIALPVPTVLAKSTGDDSEFVFRHVRGRER